MRTCRFGCHAQASVAKATAASKVVGDIIEVCPVDGRACQ
jgi:hypothetical protein